MASLVRNIATCLPCSSAATATRKAQVTRSASSRPVARLTTTLRFSAISSPLGFVGLYGRAHRAELRGLATSVLERRIRIGVDELALGYVGVRPLHQQARVLT